MPDRTLFSQQILEHEEGRNDAALERIAIAKNRTQTILDREQVSHQKTLEQKIAEQGPYNQRVDPHLIGLAILDLLNQNRLRKHTHPATGSKPWYANLLTPDEKVRPKLDELAPLYASVSGDGFGNQTGDALEVVVYKCLDQIYSDNPRYTYQGHFHLDEPKNDQRRYRKTQPPKHIGTCTTEKEADFLQFGHDIGPLCIECKNYREWLYPHHEIIKDLIVKSAELGAVPVLIARRIHYTAISNLLEPAGIIAHETYYQYYPANEATLAERVRHKRSLGFTDVTATEEPHPRTTKFFTTLLPKIVDAMGTRWNKNRPALVDFAAGNINQAQLYTAIQSPAGGKWREPE
ncbi:MAG: hypothetical protein GY788_29070 [bacterium]|nr:hypothetical protein [bacterium]